jgi:hypothetical protein
MKYVVVKNENQFVKFDFNNKITHTSNIALAERFGLKEAKALIKNNIKPKERNLYSVVLDKESEPTSLHNNQTVFENEDFSWIDTCSLMERVFSELDAYKDRLEQQLDEVQNSLTDISHKIEFPKSNGKEYNASEMTNLFKLHRDTLRQRRKIKDDLMYLHILSESSIEDFTRGRVMSRVSGMDHREHKPRVLEELFAS